MIVEENFIKLAASKVTDFKTYSRPTFAGFSFGE